MCIDYSIRNVEIALIYSTYMAFMILYHMHVFSYPWKVLIDVFLLTVFAKDYEYLIVTHINTHIKLNYYYYTYCVFS